MRSLVAVGLAAVFLAGCATRAERMSWFFSNDGAEGPKLVLGVPDSDDLRLLALCRPHSGEVRLTVFGRHGDPPILELQSGKLQSRYGGAGVEEDGETPGAVDLQFRIPADDPVLARVADTGELTLKLGDRRLVIPNGFAQEHDFLLACSAPPVR